MFIPRSALGRAGNGSRHSLQGVAALALLRALGPDPDCLAETSTGNNRPELFNVETDPAERRSLHGEHSALYRQLQQDIKAWLATKTEAAKWGKTPAK